MVNLFDRYQLQYQDSRDYEKVGTFGSWQWLCALRNCLALEQQIANDGENNSKDKED